MKDEQIKNTFDYMSLAINQKKVDEAKLSQVYAELDALELNIEDAQERIQRYEASLYLFTSKEGITSDNLARVSSLRINIENLKFHLRLLNIDKEDLFRQRDALVYKIRCLEEEISRVTSELDAVVEPTYHHVFGIESKVDEQKVYKGI